MDSIYPMSRKVDVVILGGGMCGIGAGVTLINKGKKVLLVERRSVLGWEATSAFQCRLDFTEESPLVNQLRTNLKFFGMLHNNQFDVPAFTLILDHLVGERGIDLLLYSYPLQLISKEDRVTGVVIGNKSGKQIIHADVFVDATEEAFLYRQTDVPFLSNSSVPSRQTIFFNNVHEGITLPLTLGNIDNLRNIIIHSSIREKEVCVEFDLPEYSISEARLALSKVIFFLRANIQQIGSHAIVTHTGYEPFPLEASVYLKERALQHPYFKNLFGVGIWTIPERTERQQLNTLTGRIKLGEEAGLLINNTHEKNSDFEKENISDWPHAVSVHREADVVVCGGGTAGPFAAIAAARQGAKVILLEASTLLGGMGTGGVVHAYYPMQPVGLGRLGFSSKRFEISEEVFEYCYRAFGGLQDEVDVRVAKISTFLFEGGSYKSYGFHPEAKKFVLEQMCRESEVEIVYGATVIGVEMDKERKGLIRGVIAATPHGLVTYRGKVIIDSTGDADVASMAGVPFIMGRKADGVQHTFTQLGGYLGENGNMELGGCPTDLGYIDPGDVFDLTRARRLGLRYMYKHFIPFKSRLLYIGPLLGVREARQIIGEYQLTLNDQILGRCFDDCIGYMQAHFDDHADDYENESDEAVLWVWLLGNWEKIIGCEVPYRCLLPQRVEGLLVACRGASMTIDAHYAFRMQPEMQQIGEAAGIAAALAAKLGITPKKLDVRLIQDILEKEGVLNKGKCPRPLLPKLSLPKLKEILLSNTPQEAVWQLVHCKKEEKKEVISLLREVIRSDSSQSRFWAAVALAMHKDNKAVPELVKCVQERCGDIPEGLKTVPLWWSAIVMLGRIGDSRAVPVLLEVLSDVSDESVNLDVLIAAVRALGRIQDKSAIPGLREFLKWLKNKDFSRIKKLRRPAREDVRWQIELAVAETLAKLGEPQPSIIKDYLNDPRAYVRRYAAKIAKSIDLSNNY